MASKRNKDICNILKNYVRDKVECKCLYEIRPLDLLSKLNRHFLNSGIDRARYVHRHLEPPAEGLVVVVVRLGVVPVPEHGGARRRLHQAAVALRQGRQPREGEQQQAVLEREFKKRISRFFLYLI